MSDIGTVIYKRIVHVNLNKLKKARDKQGCMTQQQLAKAIEVTASHLCSMESGDRTISGKVFRRWLKALNIRPSDVETEVVEDDNSHA